VSRDVIGLCSSSDVITFDQNWYHLNQPRSQGPLSSYLEKGNQKVALKPRGEVLSNDAQIRVIGSIEREKCTQMLRNFIEKLQGKFPSTTLGLHHGEGKAMRGEGKTHAVLFPMPFGG